MAVHILKLDHPWGEKKEFYSLWLVYALLKWYGDERCQMIIIIFSRSLTLQILWKESSLSYVIGAWFNYQEVNISRTDISRGACFSSIGFFFTWAITVKAGIFLSWAIRPHILILLIWNVNRNRCRVLISMTSQLPELQNIQYNGSSSLITPCKVCDQWSYFVRLRVIVLIVLQHPLKVWC